MSPSLEVSPDGTCGGPNQYTCEDSAFGFCCSGLGRCGYSKNYCQKSCQPEFGRCDNEDEISSSTSCSSASSSTTSNANSSTTGSSSSSSATPTGYVIVSPSSCPPSIKPTGSPISQSSSSTDTFQYQQFPNSQFIVSNDGGGEFYAELSTPDRIVLEDADGYMLILYANGTFLAFAGECELEIIGTVPLPTNAVTPRDVALFKRQSGSALCNDIQFFCYKEIGAMITAGASAAFCNILGVEVFGWLGGGVGFLGNLLGPEVGIPTTLGGVVIGEAIGAFLASKIGNTLCGVAAGDFVYNMCGKCPDPSLCGHGTALCNGKCIDILSDPNNCNGCGMTCSSGTCRNGQCAAPACDGSVCASLNSCGDDCFCFENEGQSGFCGPNVACSTLIDCNSDFDCGTGTVCAINTCCGRNVCLAPCIVSSKRRNLDTIRRNGTEMFTGGLGGVPNNPGLPPL